MFPAVCVETTGSIVTSWFDRAKLHAGIRLDGLLWRSPHRARHQRDRLQNHHRILGLDARLFDDVPQFRRLYGQYLQRQYAILFLERRTHRHSAAIRRKQLTGAAEVAVPPRDRARRPVEIALLMAVAVTPLAMAPGLFLDTTSHRSCWLCISQPPRSCCFRGSGGRQRSNCGAPLGAAYSICCCWPRAARCLFLRRSPTIPFWHLAGRVRRRLGALTQIVILFIVGVVAAQVGTRRSFTRRLPIAIEICAAVAGIYGILQYLGWDPLLPSQLYTIRFTGDIVRPPATLRHAIYFAIPDPGDSDYRFPVHR